MQFQMCEGQGAGWSDGRTPHRGAPVLRVYCYVQGKEREKEREKREKLSHPAKAYIFLCGNMLIIFHSGF